MSTKFESTLQQIEKKMIIRLPLKASELFPSRGMGMARVTIHPVSFEVPLEPDGQKSHWFELNNALCEQLNFSPGTTVTFEIEPLTEWSEPDMPSDILTAIINAGLLPTWDSLTTKARWEWLRWIRSTNNQTTRNKRIEVACSKLEHGERRPCCFDTTRCTIPEVSKTGILRQ